MHAYMCSGWGRLESKWLDTVLVIFGVKPNVEVQTCTIQTKFPVSDSDYG
jgi:hypothetical protein